MTIAIVIVVFLLLSKGGIGNILGGSTPANLNTPVVGSNGLPSLFSSGFLSGLSPSDTLATQLGNDAEFWASAAGSPTTNVNGITTQAAAATPFSVNPYTINPDGTTSSPVTPADAAAGSDPNFIYGAPPLADPSIPVTIPGAGFAT